MDFQSHLNLYWILNQKQRYLIVSSVSSEMLNFTKTNCYILQKHFKKSVLVNIFFTSTNIANS